MDEAAKKAIRADDALALAAGLGDGGLFGKPDPALLVAATQRKAKKCMELLLARGADPNGRREPNGIAALHCSQDAASVKMLVGAGADVNLVYGIAKTPPLITAASAAGPPVIKALLKAGADPDLCETSSWEVSRKPPPPRE